jgi:hypothetical protein
MMTPSTLPPPPALLIGYARRYMNPGAVWEPLGIDDVRRDLGAHYDDIDRALYDLRQGAMLMTPDACYLYFRDSGPVSCSVCGVHQASEELLGSRCIASDDCGRYEVDPVWLADNLAGYHCSDNYHAHTLARLNGSTTTAPELLLTDGAHQLRHMASCHWLFDIIASTRSLIDRHDSFAVIVLTVHGDPSATYVAAADIDDDGEFIDIYHRQHIPFTDFPLPGIKLYYALQGESAVVMLPGEY